VVVGSAWRSVDLTTRVTLLATALLAALLPLVGILRLKHATAGTTAAVALVAYAFLAVLFVPFLRGKRWAWIVLLLFYGSTLVQDAFSFRGALATSVAVVEVALLLSPRVRRYVTSRPTRSSGPTATATGS
jgi:hypothetical protein